MRHQAGRISLPCVLTMFSCLSFSAAVHAQQSNVLEAFESGTLLSEQSDIIGVRDRPQPAYSTIPYRIGSSEFIPGISIDTIYDDNIFAASNARDDLVLRVRPFLSSSTQLESLKIATNIEIDRRQYLDIRSQSTTDFALGARGQLDVSRNSRLYAGTRNGRRTEDRTDPDAPLNVRRPVQYNFASAFFGGSHGFNRLRLATRIAVETRNYSDGQDGIGNRIDQDFRNRILLAGDIAAQYSIAPGISAFVNVSVNDRNYTQQAISVPSRNSSGYRLTAGTSFELGKLVRGQFDLGYFKQSFKDPGFNDLGGLAARVRLEYFPTPLLTVTARASRGVEESSTIGSGAYVATAASLTADYEFLRNVILTAGAKYERNRFNDIDRQYSIYGAKFAAEWKLSPRYSLNIQYDYRDQNAFGISPGREFARHRLTTGITISGL
jgi:hypothetical protein